MNTSLKNHVINPAFESLFTVESGEEMIQHRAAMISFRVLSEVEKICTARNIKRKELAAMAGTSASYITQLFRGTKQVNTQIMARFEEALNIRFDIRGAQEGQNEIDLVLQQLTKEKVKKYRWDTTDFTCLWFTRDDAASNQTLQLASSMLQDNSLPDIKIAG